MAALAGSSDEAQERMQAFLHGPRREGAAVSDARASPSCCAPARDAGRPPRSAASSAGWPRDRGLAFDDYDELHRWSVDRPRGVLVVDPRVLRGARSRRRPSAVLGPPRDAGRRVVPGRDAQLRRARAAPRRRPDRRGRRASPTRRPATEVRADLGAAARPGRPGAGRAGPARRRPRRPGGGLPAEHPRDGRGASSPRRQPGRDLGELRAGVRRPQRRRPVRPGRADGAARRRRATATAARTSTAASRSPRSARACRRVRHVVHVPYGPRRAARRAGLGRAARGARRARRRAGAVRAPAVRAVLLGHHRQAEGDRARPRRDPARAPQEPRPELGPARRATGSSGSPPPPG